MNWNSIISDVTFNLRISKFYEKFVNETKFITKFINETLFYCFCLEIWLFPWHSEGNYYWGLTFVNNNLYKCLCSDWNSADAGFSLHKIWFWKREKNIRRNCLNAVIVTNIRLYCCTIEADWFQNYYLWLSVQFYISILFVCFFSSRATHYSLVCCISWCMFKFKQSSVCSLFIMIHPCNRRFSAMNDLYAIALYFSVVFLLKEILVVIFSIYSQ